MENTLSFILGPLDKRACVYFSILTIIFFVALVVAAGANIIILIKDRKNLTFRNVIGAIYMLFCIFICYFVNRLLFTMCNKSLA